MAIHVFYANRLYESLASVEELRAFRVSCGQEIYNGALMFFQPNEQHPGNWSLMDGTPPWPNSVTEEMKGYLLLLGAF